eukprot:857500-Amphidinium_carterae.1
MHSKRNNAQSSFGVPNPRNHEGQNGRRISWQRCCVNSGNKERHFMQIVICQGHNVALCFLVAYSKVLPLCSNGA